ncbi:MAG: META domain-containing protein [Rhodobacteraceae bacterium]|nr:MAG: META domain-containing protein [Paracoccaceae bacterium]
MKLVLLPLLLAALAASCDRDAPVTAYGPSDRTWQLERLDGAPFTARATLGFPAEGRLTGMAPCNSFRGPQTATYPDFAAGPLLTTRRACPDLAAEQTFLRALEAMRRAKITDTHLILSTPQGREMVFSAAPE